MRRGQRERHLMNEVRLVLANDWNPIGGPVPLDEYDSYIPRVLRTLMAGTDHNRLTEYLFELGDEGLPGFRANCTRAAENLLLIRLDE